jgi:hypothetical protein
MSADDTILILETNDGFRVAHIQAVENLWYWEISCCANPDLVPAEHDDDQLYCKNCKHPFPQYEERDEINPLVLHGWFKDSKRYTVEYDAHNAARAFQEEYGYVEYGIKSIKYNGVFPE